MGNASSWFIELMGFIAREREIYEKHQIGQINVLDKKDLSLISSVTVGKCFGFF